MEIKLQHRNKRYLLESDKHNFILSNGYKKVKNGRIRINPKFYGKIDQALLGLLNETLKGSDAKTLAELYNEISKIRRTIFNQTTT